MSFGDFSLFKYLASIVDIAIVWYVVYKLIMLIKGTKAVQLLKGIFVILIVKVLSDTFDLRTLSWIVDNIITWGFLAIIIIFQPELRRALEQLGRGRFFSRSGGQEEEEVEKTAAAIFKAADYMAKRRIGALISIERETGMTDYIETGIRLDGKVSSELLINIFIPNTPLHDGAVILQKNNVAAAACYLPLSESPFISKELGTRHRAALGISEVTDSITIIVSEETGSISLTKNGELYRDLSMDTFKDMINNEFVGKDKGKTTSSTLWNWRMKKNG
ncbi:diadenylate cyclase CdaA [Bacillus sp. FJAT-27445]|uniref:diadenylate cyclase CdaA n=1 Tax=Bacillus sp. FJAT-27445 TaxID=1679166 RepID=UPI0007437A79|nr:diadenylate cyclase CdaA [Bacillus sp. FJAT-27445]